MLTLYHFILTKSYVPLRQSGTRSLGDGKGEAGLKAAGRAVPGLRELPVAWSPAAPVPWGPGDGVQGKSCQHSPILVLCCALLGPGTCVLLGCTPQRSSKAKKGVPEGVMHAHTHSHTHSHSAPPRLLS